MKRSETNKDRGKLPQNSPTMPRNSKKARENQRSAKRRKVEPVEKAKGAAAKGGGGLKENKRWSEAVGVEPEAATEGAAVTESKRWSVAEAAVEPEMLREMGVEKLGDDASWYSEASNDSTCHLPSAPAPTASRSAPLDRDRTGDGRGVLDDLVTPDNSQEVCPKDSDPRKSDPARPRSEQGDNVVGPDFFIFRRSDPTGGRARVDEFSKLSDEIILMIFRYLPKKTLIRNALVCKRWQRISYDETLWVRLDLASRVLGAGALGYVLSRGTTVLRLSQTEFEDPVFLDDAHGTTFKLQYLCLSMAIISEKGLCSLLSSCKHLKKLSLEHTKLNADVCRAISLNRQLEVLNMASCYGVTQECIEHITLGNRKLTALNLAWTELSSEALHCLINNLTPSIERLNISGCRKTLLDSSVETLVANCPGLVELDASDCTVITTKALEHICRLKNIEHLALSRCYSIQPCSYRKLLYVSSLSFLDVYSSISEPALAMLRTLLPDVEINKCVYSSVARPTVGIRRTSIWGVRVRD